MSQFPFAFPRYRLDEGIGSLCSLLWGNINLSIANLPSPYPCLLHNLSNPNPQLKAKQEGGVEKRLTPQVSVGEQRHQAP